MAAALVHLRAAMVSKKLLKERTRCYIITNDRNKPNIFTMKVNTPHLKNPQAKTQKATKPATDAPIANVGSAPASAAGTQPNDPHRQQAGKVIGVNISWARVRRHLDKLNKVVEDILGPLKKELSDTKSAEKTLADGFRTTTDHNGIEVKEPLTAGDRAALQEQVNAAAPKRAELEAKIKALSRERVRFSNKAPVALSIVCNELVQQLVEHAMHKVIVAKKKIVQIEHLHECGVESLPLYSLVRSLPSFIQTEQKIAADKKKKELDDLVNETREQVEKEFKKKFSDILPKKKKGPTETVVAPAELLAVACKNEAPDSKTTFRFYVSIVCRDVIKKNEAFAHVRVSTEIRVYLSKLLIELIHRLSSLIQLTTNAMKIKTVDHKAILKTVEQLLIDGHSPVEAITFKEVLVTDPEVLKIERAKRDAAKKAGTEYKIDVDKLGKIPKCVAVRTLTYDESSGFVALQKMVKEKLALFDNNKPKAAALKA